VGRDIPPTIILILFEPTVYSPEAKGLEEQQKPYEGERKSTFSKWEA
jgi:hypothetical protein